MIIGQFDWVTCEKKIVEELFAFQENCQVSSKDTRVIILIFLPMHEEVNADECRNSLKKAIQQRNPEDPWSQCVKHIFCFTDGFPQMNQSKDFVKRAFENVTQYYAAKKRDNKQKQKKLINKDQSEYVRYSFKIGIYSQLSKGNLTATLKHIREAYENIKGGITTNTLQSRANLNEKRENADIINL